MNKVFSFSSKLSNFSDNSWSFTIVVGDPVGKARGLSFNAMGFNSQLLYQQRDWDQLSFVQVSPWLLFPNTDAVSYQQQRG